jgi:hypothetical protein
MTLTRYVRPVIIHPSQHTVATTPRNIFKMGNDNANCINKIKINTNTTTIIARSGVVIVLSFAFSKIYNKTNSKNKRKTINQKWQVRLFK